MILKLYEALGLRERERLDWLNRALGKVPVVTSISTVTTLKRDTCILKSRWKWNQRMHLVPKLGYAMNVNNYNTDKLAWRRGGHIFPRHEGPEDGSIVMI